MAMRNYGAMLDEKLLRCIRELHGQYGEAYERVQRQARYPANSVRRNLENATTVARERGLSTPAFEPPPKPKPAPEPANNNLCRGCAGTGVDYSVHPRMVQAARGPWQIGPLNSARPFTPAGTRLLGLGVVSGEPLAELLETFATLRAQGREIRHEAGEGIPFPLTDADLCTWCDGWGIATEGKP